MDGVQNGVKTCSLFELRRELRKMLRLGRTGLGSQCTIFTRSRRLICFTVGMNIIGRKFGTVADLIMLEEDLQAFKVFERRVLRTILGGVQENGER